ncbi:MAG: bifunctional demethylmenaquinone methyltransferase/2-methoxy-6-polyprenyl-1,4-benzoquinol methylase UbiE [Bacteroidia bacterium]|jgi:demethylmenaquinone methyltransferase/2-methoxy-6-polyprenyl-1,4-benzoquinol methylase|nr:bifunctional demethylmenaquinone methyltransferase/2-methoxy-6-polyprenyl-1,4-benzoquinol methylase UbiE [Bacteroidia bacterium]
MASVTPYNNSDSKKNQVAQMFDNIAFRYDFLNSLLSLGIHKGWRKKCIKLIAKKNPQYILDVATGTADFAIEALKLNPTKVVGVDISEGMMKFGRVKIEKLKAQSKITLHYGDAETCDLADNSMDAITVGFGVRNFEHLEKGLINMNRILKPGGQICILEFSTPRKFPFKQFYKFYFKFVTPTLGKIFSKDARAYTYLPESIKVFPDNEHFVSILKNCGYVNASFESLNFGLAAIYLAEKK